MSRFGLIFGVIVCVLVFGVCSCSDRGGDAPAAYTGDGVSLFDGKSLDGWTVINCKAVVDGGDILLVEGNGLVQSKEKYGNFVLEFDWKPLAEDKWDSGIYFRYDTVPKNRFWPKQYQVNLKKGQEGNMSSLEGATSKDLFKPGQWNRFKITVDGVKVSLQINGKEAWQTEGLSGPEKGYIALQAEVPQGGKHRFRNIYITELKEDADNTGTTN
ncbi:MAG: DUF1080 domain-containing protein [Planctomycetes bacterium]|nr:DUF1080 domain-containing protein [Planctomycetota bacterium]